MAKRMTQMADEAEAMQMQGNHEPSEAPDAPWIDDDTGPLGAASHQHYTAFLDEDEIDLVDYAEPYDLSTAGFKPVYYTSAGFDVVEKPAHYNMGQFEVIDVIADKLTPDQFVGYCMGNVYKYTMRFQYKGGAEDLAKARWYLDRAIKVLEKTT